MTSSPSTTITFSTPKLALLLAGSAVFVLIGVWLVTGDFTETRRGVSAPVIGWASILFFGLCGAVGAKKLILGGRSALTLSNRGFAYPPFSPDEVSWSLVTDIQSLKLHRTSFVAIELEREAAMAIRRNRMMHFANWGDKRDGSRVYLSSNVLSLSHDQLYTTLRDHWIAAGAAPIGPDGSNLSAGE